MSAAGAPAPPSPPTPNPTTAVTCPLLPAHATHAFRARHPRFPRTPRRTPPTTAPPTTAPPTTAAPNYRGTQLPHHPIPRRPTFRKCRRCGGLSLRLHLVAFRPRPRDGPRRHHPRPPSDIPEMSPKALAGGRVGRIGRAAREVTCASPVVFVGVLTSRWPNLRHLSMRNSYKGVSGRSLSATGSVNSGIR
jgi:hypothetical protein